MCQFGCCLAIKCNLLISRHTNKATNDNEVISVRDSMLNSQALDAARHAAERIKRNERSLRDSIFRTVNPHPTTHWEKDNFYSNHKLDRQSYQRSSLRKSLIGAGQQITHKPTIAEMISQRNFFSKNSNFQLESDAEEIYIPESLFSGEADDERSPQAYKKMRHLNGNMYFDRSDQNEPSQPNIPNMFLIDDNEPEETEQLDEQDMYHQEFDEEFIQTKKESLFNYTGMSFQDYVKSFDERINDEMKALVELFILQKQTKHHMMHLTTRKLQLKHPILRLISQNALKWILDRAILFKLKRGQSVYQQGYTAQNQVYFVLYGEVDYKFSTQPKKFNRFGEPCGLGWTVGEEILFVGGKIKRMETVQANKDSCLLQLKIEDLSHLSKSDLKFVAGDSFIGDFKIFMSFLESNFQVKNDWRVHLGIVEGEEQELQKTQFVSKKDRQLALSQRNTIRTLFY